MVTTRKPGKDFGAARVTMADPDNRGVRTSVAEHEDRPFIALSKQGSERDGDRVVGLPDCYMNDDTEIVPKPCPRFWGIDKLDRDADPLLLDAER